MDLDLSNWSERHTYFAGRFYDLPTQLLVRAALRQGETFVDVGANIGMITLLAARCVNTKGEVHAFEPNPMAFRRLKECIEVNQLESRVHVHHLGLADKEDDLTLQVVTEHTGMGTFATVPLKDVNRISNTYHVRVASGDDVLPANLMGPTVVKIDVEGFEYRVLRGMHRTIERLKPMVIAETVPELLARDGASVAGLFEIMSKHGYEGFALDTRRRWYRHGLVLKRSHENIGPEITNVAWIHSGSVYYNRLKPWLIL